MEVDYSSVQGQIEKVQRQIQTIEGDIQKACGNVLSALSEGKQDLAKYWEKKEERLHRNERELHEEKRQLQQQLHEKQLKMLRVPGVVDFIRAVAQPLIGEGTALPNITQLPNYITKQLEEAHKFPVSSYYFERLCLDDAAHLVFRRAGPHDGYRGTDELVLRLLKPPASAESEDSFHHFWDSLIFDPMHTFLEGFGLVNNRKEAGDSTSARLRADVTFCLGGHPLLKGEEKGWRTGGDPVVELYSKDVGLYFDSLPYVLGYHVRAYSLVLCALHRPPSARGTVLAELVRLDLNALGDRIRLFLACFHMAKLLVGLKQRCLRYNVEPDVMLNRANDKVVEVYEGQVRKRYPTKEQLDKVIGIYEAVRGCPYAEELLHDNTKKMHIWTCRGFNKDPSDESELVQCLECVLTALVWLHQKGIMHRDIRWDNVMRSTHRNNEWFLIDFDEACAFPCQGHTLLNPANHAPEVSGEHGEKVDIWGVGYLIKTSMVVLRVLIGSKLQKLRDLCLAQEPSARPTAEECLKMLS